MNKLPKDPFMLLSVVNMKLRDYYPSLDAMCDDMELDKNEILRRLHDAGFDYMPEINQFR